MNAQMPDIFNLDLGDSTGEDFTSQVAAQNQQLNPSSQGWGSILGTDLSSAGSAGAVAPNTLSNPAPALTSAATLPAGLSTPATPGTTTTTTGTPAAPITAAATLPSGLSDPNSMNLAAAAAPASAPGVPSANAAVAPVTALQRAQQVQGYDQMTPQAQQGLVNSYNLANAATAGTLPSGRTLEPWMLDSATAVGPQHVVDGQLVPGAINAPQTPGTATPLPDMTNGYPAILPGEGQEQFLERIGLWPSGGIPNGVVPGGGPPGGETADRQSAQLAAMANFRQQQSQVSPVAGLSAQEFLTLEQTPGNQYYGGTYGLSAEQLAAIVAATSGG